MHFKPVLLGLVALGWTTSVNASFQSWLAMPESSRVAYVAGTIC